jgi:uncharacterized protein YqgC (DUF456 family)
MLPLTLYALLLLLSLAAILLNIVSLPGNWIMFLLAIGWSWYNAWARPPLWFLPLMMAVLLGAEALEFLGGMIGARKFGASKLAAWAAIAGAMIGAVLGLYIPIPLIGSLIGAVIGAFVAALVVELLKDRPMRQAAKAALGAALGRGVGIFVKLAAGFLVWVFLALTGIPK